MDEIKTDNIFTIIQGNKPIEDTNDGIPQNEYVIVDIDGAEYFASGFLLFTSHHLAVMRDTGAGALPILVVPLNRVMAAELVEDDEVYDPEVELSEDI